MLREFDDASGALTITFEILAALCGQQRAHIALIPAKSISEVLLKVRAFAATSPYFDTTADLRREIEGRRGHAYDEDIAKGVMLDLMRLGGMQFDAGHVGPHDHIEMRSK